MNSKRTIHVRWNRPAKYHKAQSLCGQMIPMRYTVQLDQGEKATCEYCYRVWLDKAPEQLAKLASL